MTSALERAAAKSLWGDSREPSVLWDLSGQNLPSEQLAFVGETGHEAGIMLSGKLTHRRTINSKYSTSTIEWLHEHVDPCASRVEGKPRFKYLLPLDYEIAERTNKLAQTYPKRRATSETSDTPAVHPGEGRAARTVALHFQTE